MDRQDTKADKQHSWNAACAGARRMRGEQSGHPESSQGPSDFCTVYSQMLYQLSYSRNGLCPQATSTLFAIVCCTGVQHWENGGRDDLERFFEQEQFSKIGVEKPPKSSRPDFPKYCPPKPSADSGMDRQDTKADKQHSWNAACAGARSSQGPSDFCTVYSQMLYQLSYSRNGLCPQATSSLFAIFFQSDALPTEL